MPSRNVSKALQRRLERLHAKGTAMKRFPDKQLVRLRSAERRGMYLTADDDGVGVYLSSSERESRRAAWLVHCVVRGTRNYILLHGAAYGRYLKATNDAAPSGHIGLNVIQGTYENDKDKSVDWIPVEVREGGDHFILQNRLARLLRANGKYSWWRTGVTVDGNYDGDTMMHWEVEPITAAALAPPPSRPQPTPPVAYPGAFWSKLLHRTQAVEERRKRRIRWVQAAADGSFDTNTNNWEEFEFHGRSVFNLRSRIGQARGNVVGFEMTVLAGSLGRLTSLVTDLPRNEDTVYVVVRPDGTPIPITTEVKEGLQDPEVPHPQQEGLQEQEILPPQPGAEMTTFKELPSHAKEKTIQREDRERPSISAAGAALGEHQSIGVPAAAQNMEYANLILEKVQADLRQMEGSYDRRLRTYNNEHQRMTKERRAQVKSDLRKLDKDITKTKERVAILEEKARDANEIYLRELRRAQNATELQDPNVDALKKARSRLLITSSQLIS